ncbi:MAG: hypothetical protein SAL70_34500 [Scytonema sp. PMC 1070.18]|nr:hypothetical protein [Scytonema sp. PMC 1070.18]
MIGKERGAWILGTRATQWQIEESRETLITSNDEPEIIKQKIDVIKDSTITAIEINYRNLALWIAFNNGCKLSLQPNIEDDVELAYWEMFTPEQMVFKVGPGKMWFYSSSNKRANVN